MDNRERDRMNQRGSSSESSKNMESSEHLGEGGKMRNKDQENLKNQNIEPSRRPSGDSGYGSSSGRSGSMESDIERDKDRSSDLNENVEQPRRSGSSEREH